VVLSEWMKKINEWSIDTEQQLKTKISIPRDVRASRSVGSAKQSSFWLLLAAHVESGINTQLIASIKHLFWLLVDELMPRVQLTTLGVRPLHWPFRCNPWNIPAGLSRINRNANYCKVQGLFLHPEVRGGGGMKQSTGHTCRGELKICVNWCTSVDVLENEIIFYQSVCLYSNKRWRGHDCLP